jgi:hypothetical protein
MISAEAAVEIARSLAEVFAFVDNFANAPQWNDLCVELSQVSPGPRAPGTTLRYVHNTGGFRQEMEGVITHYEPNRQLGMRYRDELFDVVVDFRFAAAGATTRVDHTLAVAPRGAHSEGMVPMLLSAIRQQVAQQAAKLKQALEASRP